MKKTIRQLENELSVAQFTKEQWEQKYYNLEKETKRKQDNEIFKLREDNDILNYQVKTLLEIIRWQINPETAKYPFMATKDQRIENSYKLKNQWPPLTN